MENYKRLERDTQHKVIGGVCSGLANYFDIDASLLRVLFVFMFLFASAGFWLYVLLWIVMPADVTATVIDESGHTVVETSGRNPGRRGGIALGLILIAIGAVALLNRFMPEINWQTVWPVLLIVLGILVLLPSRGRK